MKNAYSVAVGMGYPYIRGDGREEGGVWLSRFTKTADGSGPALFIGFKGKRTIIIEEKPSKKKGRYRR